MDNRLIESLTIGSALVVPYGVWCFRKAFGLIVPPETISLERERGKSIWMIGLAWLVYNLVGFGFKELHIFELSSKMPFFMGMFFALSALVYTIKVQFTLNTVRATKIIVYFLGIAGLPPALMYTIFRLASS
jgi:hypothetical protein